VSPHFPSSLKLTPPAGAPQEFLERLLLRRQCDGLQKRRRSIADIPWTNFTGAIIGPLNAQAYVPFLYFAPNTSAVGAGGGPVFVGPSLDTNFNFTVLPGVNLIAEGKSVPWLGPRIASTSGSSSSGHGNGATVLGALLAGVVVLLLA